MVTYRRLSQEECREEGADRVMFELGGPVSWLGLTSSAQVRSRDQYVAAGLSPNPKMAETCVMACRRSRVRYQDLISDFSEVRPAQML